MVIRTLLISFGVFTRESIKVFFGFFFGGTYLCMDGDGHRDDLKSLECVVQPKKFSWVALDSLTDRRESVGTEDSDGIGDDEIEA